MLRLPGFKESHATGAGLLYPSCKRWWLAFRRAGQAPALRAQPRVEANLFVKAQTVSITKPINLGPFRRDDILRI